MERLSWSGPDRIYPTRSPSASLATTSPTIVWFSGIEKLFKDSNSGVFSLRLLEVNIKSVEGWYLWMLFGKNIKSNNRTWFWIPPVHPWTVVVTLAIVLSEFQSISSARGIVCIPFQTSNLGNCAKLDKVSGNSMVISWGAVSANKIVIGLGLIGFKERPCAIILRSPPPLSASTYFRASPPRAMKSVVIAEAS